MNGPSIIKYDPLFALNKDLIVQQQAVVQTMLGNDSSPFLVLIVRRSHVIEDALNQIAANITELKKPLRVKFAGEEGVDAGGVQKEFFHLCIEHIVDLNYGRWLTSMQRI